MKLLVFVMFIAKIDLSGMFYSRTLNRHEAKIHITGPDTDVTLGCAAYFAPSQSINAVASALISDAIRQLQRLPRFRKYHEKLIFGSGAMPSVAREFGGNSRISIKPD